MSLGSLFQAPRRGEVSLGRRGCGSAHSGTESRRGCTRSCIPFELAQTETDANHIEWSRRRRTAMRAKLDTARSFPHGLDPVWKSQGEAGRGIPLSFWPRMFRPQHIPTPLSPAERATLCPRANHASCAQVYWQPRSAWRITSSASWSRISPPSTA